MSCWLLVAIGIALFAVSAAAFDAVTETLAISIVESINK